MTGQTRWPVDISHAVQCNKAKLKCQSRFLGPLRMWQWRDEVGCMSLGDNVPGADLTLTYPAVGLKTVDLYSTITCR